MKLKDFHFHIFFFGNQIFYGPDVCGWDVLILEHIFGFFSGIVGTMIPSLSS